MSILKWILLLTSISIYSCQTMPTEQLAYSDYPVYRGTDLGLTYQKEATQFKVWSPSADQMTLSIYDAGQGGKATEELSMKKGEDGVWHATAQGDLLGKYYTFKANIGGEWSMEVPDPYAKAVGVNGQRGMVIDLAATNPDGWEADQRPPLNSWTDAVIYELHVRDLSMDPNSGIEQRGKFLGLTERGTRAPNGEKTGLDHIKELGVTHIHLLPSYDYKSVDESQLDTPQFNWGYDPQNYNIPEGSYATDPYDGRVRIREFKQMVKTLHEQGLRVIMDVVYNHTYENETSNFNQLVPGYYYRQNESGGFSDASACGNETASERPMFRKFMLESVKYWVEEYHVDGFRFDLMGIHDLETMNLISRELHQIDSTILLYGEGWTAGASPLPDAERALKANTKQMNGIAAFSDDIRDGIRGHVFTPEQKGFISGQADLAESIKFGVVASTSHPQVDYSKVNYSKSAWAKHPIQTISYASCHDNHTLWDRLEINTPEADESTRKKIHLLALTIVLTSQGIPFLHAGTEMLRTKQGEENSYKSPDEINRLDWSRKTTHRDAFLFVKELIALRRDHPAFRMQTTELVQKHLVFLEDLEEQLVAFTLNDHANGDPWEKILVAYNGGPDSKALDLPEGTWKVALENEKISSTGFRVHQDATFNLAANSAIILFQN